MGCSCERCWMSLVIGLRHARRGCDRGWPLVEHACACILGSCLMAGVPRGESEEQWEFIRRACAVYSWGIGCFHWGVRGLGEVLGRLVAGGGGGWRCSALPFMNRKRLSWRGYGPASAGMASWNGAGSVLWWIGCPRVVEVFHYVGFSPLAGRLLTGWCWAQGCFRRRSGAPSSLRQGIGSTVRYRRWLG